MDAAPLLALARSEGVMGRFQGFSEVRRELGRGFRAELENIAIAVERFDFLAAREYVLGRCLATGREVRATLADRRTYEKRPSLADRREQLGCGGVLVLADAWRNRNGTFEAFNAIPFPNGAQVLTDGMARISAPVQRQGGTWAQSIQHFRSTHAVRCFGYHDVVDAVLDALASDGPGRAGATVRGYHAARDGVMGFDIGLVFDAETRRYLTPEASFDAFLGAPDIWVGGINARVSAERCMATLSRLMAEHPGEIVWEVIPKRTYSMGGIVAEQAGLGTRRDPSKPYRLLESGAATGCLASVIGLVERDGVFWPRFVAPMRPATPIAPLRIATANATPGCGNAAGPKARDDARRAAASGSRHSVDTRGRAAADPLTADDAPPPAPPPLTAPPGHSRQPGVAFSSSLANGGGMLDQSAFDALDDEDAAALSRLEALAAELKVPGAA